MSSGNDYTAALNAGYTFHSLGQEWTLSEITAWVKARYEGWLREKMIAGVMSHRGELAASDYNDVLNKRMEDLDMGLYTFGSEKCMQSINTESGTKHLLYLQLKEHHKEVTEAKAAEVYEGNKPVASAMLNLSLKKFVGILEEETEQTENPESLSSPPSTTSPPKTAESEAHRIAG